MTDIRIFTHYSNMSGSGTRRTEDIHTVRTRQLILQNQDGTYPTQGNLFSVNSSRGLVGKSAITTTDGGTILLIRNVDSPGDASLGGMQVNGITVISTADISGILFVGNRTFLRGTDISGTLNIYGDTNLVDCTVLGNTQLDTLNIPSDLSIDSSCNLGYLNVQGDTILNDVTFVGAVPIDNIDISGYLNVGGQCQIDGDLRVQGDTVFNNLRVTGNIPYPPPNIDISGFLNVHGSCHIGGDTVIDSSLYVSQLSQCNNVDISGYLHVDGVCNLGSLNVQGATVCNNLTITGRNTIQATPTQWDISGNLTVHGPCSMSGPLYVAQNSQFTQTSQFNNMDISGYLNVTYVGVNGNLDISGTVPVITKFIDSSNNSTNSTAVSISNNGYMYGYVNPSDEGLGGSEISFSGSGLPMFGYIVWAVDASSTSYSYAPTFPIISSCRYNDNFVFNNRMGLPYADNELSIKCIVVAPYTTIVFNTNSTFDDPSSNTCNNSTSPTPTTFLNNGSSRIQKLTNWSVFRYSTTGIPFDSFELAGFLSNTLFSGVPIT